MRHAPHSSPALRGLGAPQASCPVGCVTGEHFRPTRTPRRAVGLEYGILLRIYTTLVGKIDLREVGGSVAASAQGAGDRHTYGEVSRCHDPDAWSDGGY
jgi:hypothetical protein